MRDVLKCLDPRIVNHGQRTAYILYSMLRDTNRYEMYELAEFAISHDIGLTMVGILPFIFRGLFNASISFGGTSLIIIVSVILETIKQIESMMLVRNYKGFLND